MKKIGACCLFFLVPLLAFAESESVHRLEYNLDGAYRFDGDEWLAEHTLQYDYKVSSDYSLETQVKFHTNYIRDEENPEWHNDNEHHFARVRLYGPTFAEVLGFTSRWAIQYTLPTSEEYQKAGNYGALGARVYFEREFNKNFNLSIVPIVQIVLNRNGSQLNDPARERNELGSAAINIAPQLVLGSLTLTYDSLLGVAVEGHAPGESNIQSTGIYEGDLELLNNFESLGDLGLGVFFAHSFAFGKGAAAHDSHGNFLHISESYAGLRIIKGFDL